MNIKFAGKEEASEAFEAQKILAKGAHVDAIYHVGTCYLTGLPF